MAETIPNTNYQVIITGPESTGKSELSVLLANKFNGQLYPEYARRYLSHKKKEYNYNYNDIEKIAQKQYQHWELAVNGNCAAFFDTHLIITKIWFQWVYSKHPDWINDAIAETKHALYLLCYYDLDWVPDPLRENGGQSRIELYNAYLKQLNKFNLNYKIIKGTGAERSGRAIRFIKQFLASL